MLGLLAIVLIARRMVPAATLLFALALLLPMADATIVVSRIGIGQCDPHGVTMALLGAVTILLWRRPENAMRGDGSA